MTSFSSSPFNRVFLTLSIASLVLLSVSQLQAQTIPYPIQDLIFFPQKSWQSIPTQSKREVAHWIIPPPPIKATLTKGTSKPLAKKQEKQAVPKQPEDNSPLELVIYFFGASQPEDIATNIQAWQEEIESSPLLVNRPPPTIIERKIATLNTYEINLHGQFKIHSSYPSMPAIPLPNYQLIGFIIERPAGNLYLRLTGPSASVDRFKKTWNEFINSIRLAKAGQQAPLKAGQKK